MDGTNGLADGQDRASRFRWCGASAAMIPAAAAVPAAAGMRLLAADAATAVAAATTAGTTAAATTTAAWNTTVTLRRYGRPPEGNVPAHPEHPVAPLPRGRAKTVPDGDVGTHENAGSRLQSRLTIVGGRKFCLQ